MSKPVLLSAKFRHVVFPDEAGRRRKAVNLAAEGVPEPPPLPEWDPPGENAAFVHWLFAQAGLDARAYRPETLHRRLSACLRGLRARSVAEARRAVETNPALVGDAVGYLLVGVTAFFRDPVVFDALAQDFLPPLARGRRGLNVWSAGCSDGAELYSVGILFAEKGWLPGSSLLGTDCRADAVRRARAGCFEAFACKNVPPHLLTTYFQGEGRGFRVASSLRNALRWRTADLLKVQEPGTWDVILCRNTTMYLRAEATAPLWQKFEALLRPGGLLVTGKAERPVGAKGLVPVASCVFRRTRG
jgi:chemotaxis protein methyltransferase CheR